jgi:hypothetical protein
MDARELEKLLNVALAHKGAEQFLRNITFIVSYLKSEQDKREALSAKLEEHSRKLADYEKDMIMTKRTVEEIKDSSKANGKMLRAILVALVSGIIIEALKLAFHK